MGSYASSITQDLRTVVEGAETVASPESLQTLPLSGGIKSDQWMQNVSLEQVMPGAIKTKSGNVTIQEVSGDIVSRVLQSSDLNLAQVISSADDQLERSDQFTQSIVEDVLAMTDEYTKTAMSELGDVTLAITKQRSDELDAGKQLFDKIPGALSAVVVIGIVLYFGFIKKG